MKAASTSLLMLLALLGCGSQEPTEAGGTPTVRTQPASTEAGERPPRFLSVDR